MICSMDIEPVKPHIAALAEKYGLSLVVLFGSQATGHTHKESDVDVAYLASRDVDYRDSYDITQSLAYLFKNRNVELANLDRVSPDFKKQVADDGIVLFDRTGMLFDLFSIHANRMYIATKPLREYRDSYVKSFIQTHA